jgi:hypothetical protein
VVTDANQRTVTERNPTPADWRVALLADARARADTMASLLARELLHDPDNRELAALVSLADRVWRDLDRAVTELRGDPPPIIVSRTRQVAA